MKWRPIETAPKDGTVVLAWRYCQVAIKWTGDDEYPWEAVQLGGSIGLSPDGFQATDPALTRWMPLPPPPTEDA